MLRIVFFTAALFYLQWDLALISLLVAPLFWLAAKRFSRLIKVASREKRRRSGSISSVAEESLSNVALVQAYGQEQAEVERFHRENLGSYHAEMASDAAEGALHAADRPDRAERRAARDRARHLGALARAT